MTKCLLNENIPTPQKLAVRFSSELYNDIRTIRLYNQGNEPALSNWKKYLDSIKTYMSDTVIAWDNMGRYRQLQGGNRRFIADFGYNIGYAVIIDSQTYLPFVFIFMVNLKVREFELKMPPSLQRKIKENIHYYNMKQKIRLTEGDLHRIIKSCINEVKLGGESFHGNDFEDWDAMVGVRQKWYNKDSDNKEKHSKAIKRNSRNLLQVAPPGLGLCRSELSRRKEDAVLKNLGLRESDYHRAYKSSKNLKGIGVGSSYTESDIWDELDKLKTLLYQAEERAKTGNFDEGNTRNYLVGAIRGLEAFVRSRR